MKVLITGSRGFIGQHLCKFLIEHGISIFELNRELGIDYSVPGWTRKIGIDSVDIVIHLAQSNHYRDFENYAEDIFGVNVHATFELLEWARKTGVRKFIYASTASVYKNNSSSNCEYSATLGTDFYQLSKLLSEQISRFYTNYFETIILRIYTVYGPGQRRMLIPQMIDKIFTQESIFLAQGEGIYLSPIYIEDLVFILKMIISSKGGTIPSILNIAGPQKISLFEIVKIIGEKLQREPILQTTPAEVLHFDSNSVRLTSILPSNFNFTPIEIGLQNTIDEAIKNS